MPALEPIAQGCIGEPTVRLVASLGSRRRGFAEVLDEGDDRDSLLICPESDRGSPAIAGQVALWS
jgi:hypothetical protein